MATSIYYACKQISFISTLRRDLVADIDVRPFLQHGSSSVNPTSLAEDMEHRVTLLGIDGLLIKTLHFHLSQELTDLEVFAGINNPTTKYCSDCCADPPLLVDR